MNATTASLIADIDRRQREGDLVGACAIAESAPQAGIHSLAIGLRLVGLYLKLGRYRDASTTTAAIADLPAASPVELIDLGKRLMYFNESEAVSRLGRGRLRAPSRDAAAEADLAAIISMAGDQAVAMPLLERAIATAGATPAWLYNRSQMRLYAGRFAEAEADLRHALRLAPTSAKAYWALSKLPGREGLEADVARLRALAGRVGAEEPFRQFALFNRLDRLDRRDEAWAALEAGCRAKRAQVNYDAAATAAYFAALRTREFPRPAISADGEGPIPIFIVGMHRSGTTLLEHLLGNHSQVAEGGELYDLPAQLRFAAGRHFAGPSDPLLLQASPPIDFAEVGRRYLQHVRWRAGGRRFLIDKLPSNFINLGYLRAALPQARVLHMERAPMDTCFSNLKELFANACAYSYDADELADYFAQYQGLMAHWRNTLPGFLLDVSYEDLTASPEAQARRILAFCGLDWEPGCINPVENRRAVNTASSAQVREPIHRRNVGAWERYAAPLAPLRDRLRERGVLPDTDRI